MAERGRSRKGAWIEIRDQWNYMQSNARRSRKGAWIEIYKTKLIEKGVSVAPVRERGLKFGYIGEGIKDIIVAPVRERGLKYFV